MKKIGKQGIEKRREEKREREKEGKKESERVVKDGKKL